MNEIMTRAEILNKINDYYLEADAITKQKIIDLMNELLKDNEYKKNLDLFFLMISLTQSYGFLMYLDEEEKDYFYLNDFFTTNSYSSLQLDYLNSGQMSLFEELRKNKKVFVSASTSFGKTSIVNDFVLTYLNEFSNIIYIVPTNSLLEELYIKFTKYIKNKDGINISTQPQLNEFDKNILFLTPERFLIFYEKNETFNIDLIIMDETYKIMDFQSERVSDFINSRSLRFRKVADIIAKSNGRVIFLSPFTYESTNSMNRFLNTHNIKKIDRKLKYVSHEHINISDAESFHKCFPNERSGYRKSSSISYKAARIIECLKEEKNIVYVSGYGMAYEIASKYPSNLYNMPNNDRFTKFLRHLNDNFTIDSNTRWNVISSLEKGIGIYIAPVPRYIKREIIKLFEEDILHTLIVTTSFTEGVNSAAKNLIFTTLQTGNVKLSDIDVLNVAGRAGRFGKNSIGKIYCINNLIYNKIEELKNEELIKLENYNYYLDNERPSGSLIDYEIDMMDDDFLTDEEKEEKQKTEDILRSLNLTKRDLNISLNVSTKWKVLLYKWFLSNEEKVDDYYHAVMNLLKDESKVNSIEMIFYAIKHCFESLDQDIDPFPVRIYDIKPFDNNGGFTWGRLYRLYSSGTYIEVLRRNRDFIKKQHKEIMDKIKVKTRDSIEYEFRKNNKSWIIDKYYEKKSDYIKEKPNAFYTEAFNFMSSVIQYKMPYYLSYFVSIFKVYLLKNHPNYDVSKIDVQKIVMSFEDGIIDDENYRVMVDFGLSNDLIKKIKDNNIRVNDIINKSFDKSIFDDFELILFDDFIKVMK